MSVPATSLATRRQVLGGLGAALATAVSGCTPLRFVLHAYPAAFDRRTDAGLPVLRMFVRTVFPSLPNDDSGVSRVFDDDFYPFARYRGFFAADLASRARKRFGAAFESLSLAQRTEVVREGLHADGTTRKMYSGALFLVQVAVSCGIGMANGDVPLMEFEGPYRFTGIDAITYPDPERFLARATTTTGHPA